MDNEFESLEKIGVNIKETLERFCGIKSLFVKLIKKLPEDNSFSSAMSAIEENNIQDAVMHAHSLKGVAGNLGLGHLYDAAKNLEAALRDNDLSNIKELTDAVTREHTAAIKAISEL